MKAAKRYAWRPPRKKEGPCRQAGAKLTIRAPYSTLSKAPCQARWWYRERAQKGCRVSAEAICVFEDARNMNYSWPQGRSSLSVREKIAIALGYAGDLTFDDERCRVIGGFRELPIEQLERARDRLRPNAHQIWIAYERAVEWAYRGKDDKDKRVRLAIIRFALMKDAELGRLCFVDRQRINFLRQEPWSIIARAIADPSLKNDTF